MNECFYRRQIYQPKLTINRKINFIWYKLERATEYHRFPDWMTLRLHLVLEGLMSKIQIFNTSKNRILRALYDFPHGLICGYSMKEMLQWMKKSKPAKRHPPPPQLS